MPRPHPHPLALFSLVPLNPRADERRRPSDQRPPRLDAERWQTCSRHRSRRNGDVFIEGSSIAKVQCSFEIDPNTDVVMFYDRSHSLSSQVFGENATPFEYGRPRKVVVQKKLNTTIGLGGERRNLVQFELKWHHHTVEAMEKVKNRESAALEENPRLARTIDEADTVLPSRRETRPHTAGPQQPQMRYTIIGKQLGSGQFGVVYKAVDADTGKFMAVKILKRPTGASERIMLFNALKREVETLSRLSHVTTHYRLHCIPRLGQARGGDIHGAQTGNLGIVGRERDLHPITQLGEAVFDQMLQAIDCLATEGIIHRDVKPENILYVSQSSQYHFQLGDFGFCNRASIAATFAGSPLYMAPEMFQRGGQTHKVDVWSLYVTMLWTLDVRGFRRRSDGFRSVEDAQKAVLSAADAVSNIQEMARVNPEERASAAQMLVKCYNGKGLTTPLHRVPPLVSPAQAGTKAPAAAAPASASTSRAQPKKQRGFWKNANPVPAAAAGQFRVKKARLPLQTQPRLPIHPAAAEKHPGPALGPAAIEKRRIPGSFPHVENPVIL
ncbi:hypothetical protein H9Q71_014218 [Fusarium xylarioides]|nr:hypothetical protein H9Q71_014218 [Fusarium xylarioides]